MRQAFRIVREAHAATAFTGEGAALTGGRWNSPGVRVVYTSASASLAALETLVHLNPAMRFKYVIFSIEFDERLVEKLPPASLPAGWRDEPPPPATKRLGDAWVKQARGCWKDAFPGEEIAEVTAAVGVLRCFCFCRRSPKVHHLIITC